MSTVAVVHPSLHNRGGGEAVCMHVLEALQGDHDVRLVTADAPDLAALDEQFDTDVDAVDVRVVRVAGRPVAPAVDAFDRLTGTPLGYLRVFRLPLFHALARRHLADVDVVFDTYSEMGARGRPTVSYVHYPQYHRVEFEVDVPSRNGLFRAVDRVADAADGFDPTDPDLTLLTNSEWTADLIERTHGVSPEVVYPPIDTGEFADAPPFEERHADFVVAGRVAGDKCVLDAVDIVEGVRERGHDVDLHVVGPLVEADYAARVQDRADGRDWLHVHGKLPREEYVRVLTENRYGVHAKFNEHFGITVAEMVAAGMVPFVPNDGGQVDIVDRNPALVFDDREAAVEQICAVLDDPEHGRELQAQLPDVGERYGVERFEERIQELVAGSVRR